jgi:hypothetical protein
VSSGFTTSDGGGGPFLFRLRPIAQQASRETLAKKGVLQWDHQVLHYSFYNWILL